MAALRIFLIGLILAVAAAAVQPIYRVDADILFLPLDGLALSGHTGRVLWRFPRFTGQTDTDGHGLLLIGWVNLIQPEMERRYTRICRLRTSDGKQLWCREFGGVEQWTVDADGQVFYEEGEGQLTVASLRSGLPRASFRLPLQGDVSLLPLPRAGVMLLARAHGHQGPTARAWSYAPGSTALRAESVPASVYPFRGDGHGLLLYARQAGEFFFAAPLKALFQREATHTAAAASLPFPQVSLDGHGFVFTDWQGSTPVLRGGTYDGSLWQAPRPAGDPGLALTASTALMLQHDGSSGTSRLTGWDLSSGAERFRRSFRDNYPLLSCVDDEVVLQSDGDIRLLDALAGTDLWDARRHEGPLAATVASAVVFWEGTGQLAGLARNNGNLLWRIHFVEPKS